MTYFLVDVFRRRAMGPYTRTELIEAIHYNGNKDNIYDALRSFGVTVVEQSNLLDLEEEYKHYAQVKEEVRS